MILVYGTATEAWDGVYEILAHQAKEGFRLPGDYASGRVVGELLNQTIVISNPRKGFVHSPLRKLPVDYAVGELMWYLSGSNMLADINKYSKFWNNLSDDGDTVNSAYGHRIFSRFGFDQWEHCKNLLRADPHSRRAVIHIKEASNEPTKDTPCTLSLQFQIRDGALYMNVVMRSNDIWLGFPFDVFCFTALQVKMAMELGVDVGDYTHFTGSLHLYEKDYLRA